MTEGLNFTINFIGNAEQVLAHVNALLAGTQKEVKKTTGVFGDCWKQLMAANQAMQGLDTLKNTMADLNAPGVALNKQMADLSAITKVTGKELDAIEQAARASAKTFGTDAVSNVESYKIVLSKLDPAIAGNATALKAMGDSVNVLSKSMGGDTVASAGVLTTAMNQYGVSTQDPIAASKVMADMMNTMAAAAQAGSAELPQISQALENVGMMAKTVGVSFEETNAAIQVLDKAGATGAEGGIALRNILSSLTAPSAAAAAALESYGISTATLADPTIKLKDKLALLKPMMGDMNVVTKVFEKANVGAAIAMVDGVDKLQEYTTAITGTQSAHEQAKIVMESYEERMKRQKARLEELKIGWFNATESVQPYLQASLSLLSELGKIGAGITSLSSALNNDFTKSIYNSAKSLFTKTITTRAADGATTTHSNNMYIGAIAAKVYEKTITGVRNAMFGATLSTWGLSNAIKGIPVIGWIAAAIGAVVAAFKYLWDHSRNFRATLFGIWEAAKAVFHNIGVVIERVWNAVIKPVALFIWNIYKTVFNAIWEAVKWCFNAIVGAFNWIWNTAKAIATGIYDVVVGAFNWIYEKVSGVFSSIGGFFGDLWNWFSGLFSGFVKFINEWIVQPIKEAFGGLWDWLVGIFDWIAGKLKALVQPLIDVYNYIFGDEGMKSVNKAYDEGVAKGGADFDADQQKAGNESDTGFASFFNFLEGISSDKEKGGNPVKPTGGQPVTKGARAGGDGGSASKNIQSFTIHKLIENLHIHTTSIGESKEKLKNTVKEALLTAVADFNLATT